MKVQRGLYISGWREPFLDWEFDSMTRFTTCMAALILVVGVACSDDSSTQSNAQQDAGADADVLQDGGGGGDADSGGTSEPYSPRAVYDEHGGSIFRGDIEMVDDRYGVTSFAFMSELESIDLLYDFSDLDAVELSDSLGGRYRSEATVVGDHVAIARYHADGSFEASTYAIESGAFVELDSVDIEVEDRSIFDVVARDSRAVVVGVDHLISLEVDSEGNIQVTGQVDRSQDYEEQELESTNCVDNAILMDERHVLQACEAELTIWDVDVEEEESPLVGIHEYADEERSAGQYHRFAYDEDEQVVWLPGGYRSDDELSYDFPTVLVDVSDPSDPQRVKEWHLVEWSTRVDLAYSVYLRDDRLYIKYTDTRLPDERPTTQALWAFEVSVDPPELELLRIITPEDIDAPEIDASVLIGDEIIFGVSGWIEDVEYPVVPTSRVSLGEFE